jgi:hypothetical protein
MRVRSAASSRWPSLVYMPTCFSAGTDATNSTNWSAVIARPCLEKEEARIPQLLLRASVRLPALVRLAVGTLTVFTLSAVLRWALRATIEAAHQRAKTKYRNRQSRHIRSFHDSLEEISGQLLTQATPRIHLDE